MILMAVPSSVKKSEFWTTSIHPSDMYENINPFFNSSICKYFLKLLFTWSTREKLNRSLRAGSAWPRIPHRFNLTSFWQSITKGPEKLLLISVPVKQVFDWKKGRVWFVFFMKEIFILNALGSYSCSPEAPTFIPPWNLSTQEIDRVKRNTRGNSFQATKCLSNTWQRYRGTTAFCIVYSQVDKTWQWFRHWQWAT